MIPSTLPSNLNKVLAKTKSVPKQTLNIVFVSCVALLGGCNATSAVPASTVSLDTRVVAPERINKACIEQVQSHLSAIKAPTQSQYISMAHTAEHCLGDIQYSPKHPDVKTAMQFSALAFVNYVKAGDMNEAREALARFRTSFPQQDLLFDDYTSFVDTAIVLTKSQNISAYELAP